MAQMKKMALVNESNFAEFSAKVALDDFVPVKRENRRNRRRSEKELRKNRFKATDLKERRLGRMAFYANYVTVEADVVEKDENGKTVKSDLWEDYDYDHRRTVDRTKVKGRKIWDLGESDMKWHYSRKVRYDSKVECHDAMADKVVDGEVHIPKHIHEWIMDKWYEGLMSMIQNDEEGEIPDVTIEDYWAHFNEYVDPDELGQKGYNVTTAGEDGVLIRYKDGYYDRHLKLGYNSNFLEAVRILRIQREIDIINEKKRQLLEEYAERISVLNDMIRRREQMMK